MKKVLIMVSSMNIGGVEKSLISLLMAIPKDRFDITLLLLEGCGELLDNIPKWIKVKQALWYKNIKPIITQPPKETLKDLYNNKQFLKAFLFVYYYFISKYSNNRYIYYKNVFRAVSRNTCKYDVAIAYQGPTDVIDYYIINKVNADKKISWVHFDISGFMINKKLYSKLFKKYNKIYIVSEEAKKRLIDKMPAVSDKVGVFTNIISCELIKRMAEKHADFDVDFKGTKILTVGRLSPEKGQELAVKVLSRLLRDGYNVRWYCVGEGKNRKYLEEMITVLNLKKEFLLLGPKKNPYPFIDNADIYVQTSKHEGYCITLAEAKCLGKPIITTDFAGASEQIINGYNGFIVQYNEDLLYEKIKLLLDNPEIKNEISKNLLGCSFDTTSEVQKLLNYIG